MNNNKQIQVFNSKNNNTKKILPLPKPIIPINNTGKSPQESTNQNIDNNNKNNNLLIIQNNNYSNNSSNNSSNNFSNNSSNSTKKLNNNSLEIINNNQNNSIILTNNNNNNDKLSNTPIRNTSDKNTLTKNIVIGNTVIGNTVNNNQITKPKYYKFNIKYISFDDQSIFGKKFSYKVNDIKCAIDYLTLNNLLSPSGKIKDSKYNQIRRMYIWQYICFIRNNNKNLEIFSKYLGKGNMIKASNLFIMVKNEINGDINKKTISKNDFKKFINKLFSKYKNIKVPV